MRYVRTRTCHVVPVAAAALVLVCTPIVRAQQEQPDLLGTAVGARANQLVSPFAGSFSQSVVIAVPAFRGLEPRLALGYSSEGGNGFVGAGWGLSGFSVIQRAKAGRGTPRYDANDIYLLDGMELLTCPASGTSASCTAGGTHYTRNESFLKIRKDDPSAGKWSVWGRDGTRTVFEATHTVTFGTPPATHTFRWGQKTVTDTNSSVVTYSWACLNSSGVVGTPIVDCMPDQIAYGPFVVKLYRDDGDRPDKLSYATGNPSLLGRTNYRLRSVLVSMGGSPVRAYRLTYGTSAVTGRSLLATIEQFGKDVSIGASGVITGTSPLPAKSFTYKGDSAGQSFQAWPN